MNNKQIQRLLDIEDANLKTWSMQQIALSHSKTTLNALLRALRVVNKALYKSTAKNQTIEELYEICDSVLKLIEEDEVENG